ncbi:MULTISPECIES: DUF397 domain-containing protein [Streptomyces]|uniref:DUF397 domain-containing protein n=1 Tax=Streptomyces TaxID=1883 RepID=UPI002248A972|nr:DUF397 domain-containing protein [Streptomyces sp. JHD 1]MCX2969039.1 DUF397 domain-containing protein [Streptomyces sp. JHD 1]
MSTTELTWFKSSYSGGGGDNCIEIAIGTEAVHIRDSKDTRRGSLSIPADAWAAFTTLAADTRA